MSSPAMSSRPTQPHFPRVPLFAAGAILCLTVIGVAVVRAAGLGPAPIISTAIAERDLRFEDRADGSIAIYDTRDAAPMVVMTGQQGFLRGTMRGLARERRRDGIGPQGAFRLTAWADGRITLDDPETARHVELVSFGPTNEAVFVALLKAPRAAALAADGRQAAIAPTLQP